jgi:hypothetical protein
MSEENEERPKPSAKPIEDAIAELGRAAFQQPALCTGWVLVSEWFGGENEYWIMAIHDENSPPWRHSGMLDYAINRVADEIDVYLGEGDDYDEEEDD